VHLWGWLFDPGMTAMQGGSAAPMLFNDVFCALFFPDRPLLCERAQDSHC
jgi:hypothetical protein